MLFVAIRNDRWFDNRTNCCSAKSWHAHGPSAHDQTEKERENLDGAQETDEE